MEVLMKIRVSLDMTSINIYQKTIVISQMTRNSFIVCSIFTLIWL